MSIVKEKKAKAPKLNVGDYVMYIRDNIEGHQPMSEGEYGRIIAIESHFDKVWVRTSSRFAYFIPIDSLVNIKDIK